MKVLVYSHSYLESENQKNILALSNHCDVLCAAPDRGRVLIFGEHDFHAQGEAARLFRPLPRLKASRTQFMLRGFTAALRRFRPDIVNVEYNPWSLMFLQTLAASRLVRPRAKLVCTIKKNTYRTSGVRGAVKDRVARRLIRRVDHFLAASDMAAAMLCDVFAIPSADVTVCHHLGVDTDLFCPRTVKRDSGEGRVTIGYCGRFDADKGVADLIDAVRALTETKGRSVTLRLIGQGAYGDKLDSLIDLARSQCAWLETFAPVPNAQIAEFLQRLDIFVLPARKLDDHQEHDAHALLEALAAGVASVGADSGVIPEILGGGAGRVVGAGRPAELAEALAHLVDSAEERRRLGAAGRQKALREFSLDVIAGKKADVFRRLLDTRR